MDEIQNIIVPNTAANMSRFAENSGMLKFTASCAFIIAFLGTLGNILTIVSLLMSKKLRTPATMFVVNLAVAELIFCLIILPISGSQYVYLQQYDTSLIGHTDCIIFAATRYTVTQAELQTIVAIALTRAFAVGQPKFYQKINTNNFTIAYIIVIWIYSFLLKLPPILGIFAEYNFNRLTMECDLSTGSAIYRLFSITVEAILPILVVFILYVYIFIKVVQRSLWRCKRLKKFPKPAHPRVRKSSNRVRKASQKSVTRSVSSEPSETTPAIDDRKSSTASFKSLKRMVSETSLGSRFARRSSSITHCMTTNKRDVRLARTIFIIFFMILVCSIPVMVIHAVDREVKKPARLLAVHILYWIQYCLNMFVYVLMNRQYREAYIDCLGKIIPSLNKHRSFTFPWENPSMSSKPTALQSGSFKNRKNSISSDPKPVLEYKKDPLTPAGRLSAIVEANSSSYDDEVFANENVPSTATTSNDDECTPVKKTVEDGSQEEKEIWIDSQGINANKTEGEVV